MESMRAASNPGSRTADADRKPSNASPDDELVDVVDAEDHVVGSVRRDEVWRLLVNVRVVHVLVFNESGDLLLQHIAAGHRHAGSWGSSAAGLLRAGETYDDAAVRKVRSELGIVTPLTSLGTTRMCDGARTKFIGVYSALYDGPFIVDPVSASQVEFLSISAIDLASRNATRAFTATFLHVLDYCRGNHRNP